MACRVGPDGAPHGSLSLVVKRGSGGPVVSLLVQAVPRSLRAICPQFISENGCPRGNACWSRHPLFRPLNGQLLLACPTSHVSRIRVYLRTGGDVPDAAFPPCRRDPRTITDHAHARHTHITPTSVRVQPPALVAAFPEVQLGRTVKALREGGSTGSQAPRFLFLTVRDRSAGAAAAAATCPSPAAVTGSAAAAAASAAPAAAAAADSRLQPPSAGAWGSVWRTVRRLCADPVLLRVRQRIYIIRDGAHRSQARSARHVQAPLRCDLGGATCAG